MISYVPAKPVHLGNIVVAPSGARRECKTNHNWTIICWRMIYTSHFTSGHDELGMPVPSDISMPCTALIRAELLPPLAVVIVPTAPSLPPSSDMPECHCSSEASCGIGRRGCLTGLP